MTLTIDGEGLSGAHTTRFTVRPERRALTVNADNAEILSTFEYLCECWAGANSPIIPVRSGRILDMYHDPLREAEIDSVQGLRYNGLQFKVMPELDPIKPQNSAFEEIGTQWAYVFYNYQEQATNGVVSAPELRLKDPWREIYGACLGRLPESPTTAILTNNRLQPGLRFEDFLQIERPLVDGSIRDLMERLSTNRAMSPRIASMVGLASGIVGNPNLRWVPTALPDPLFKRHDAMPNVLVVCSERNVEDLTLLWNLRAACGDTYVTPIGVPVAQLSIDLVKQVLSSDYVSRHGGAVHSLYVTSASVPRPDLETSLHSLLNDKAGRPSVSVAEPQDLLWLGPAAGAHYAEAVVWKDGEADVVPKSEVLTGKLQNASAISPYLRFQLDVSVVDNAYPYGAAARAEPMNGVFRSGLYTRALSISRPESIRLQWPDKLLMTRVIASRRDLELDSSAAGTSVAVLLDNLSLFDVRFLAHKPLLDLLEEMASTTGFNWAKKWSRLHQQSPEDQNGELRPVIAPSVQDVSHRPVEAFKRVLGNSQTAAANWLFWAERKGLIVKGFELACANCDLKQWVPVAAFRPPVVCNGCAQTLHTPFQARTSVAFSYTVSEKLRRVYEHDAVGHLFVMYFFAAIFSFGNKSPLLGAHPGLDVKALTDRRRIGEADVVLLMRTGDLIPIEIKRSLNSLTADQVDKLDELAARLVAPWSVLAGCEYGATSPPKITALAAPDINVRPFRLLLSYDRLLDPHPVWPAGENPFEWAPLTVQQIEKREADFVNSLKRDPVGESWYSLSYDMLRKPYGEDS